MKKHLNKIENVISGFEKLGHISGKNANVKRVNFETLLIEVLNENKLFKQYPQVRYSFNLLEANSFISDISKVKVILKHILVNAFHSSSKTEMPQVKLTIKSNGTMNNVQIWNNGQFVEDSIKQNGFPLSFFGSVYSESSGTGLSFIKETLKKLNGNLLITSNGGIGTSLNISIPDMEAGSKHILPYTSASMKIV